MEKGEDLDIGSTIYDDNHGLISGGMFLGYMVFSPITAIYDFVVKVTE